MQRHSRLGEKGGENLGMEEITNQGQGRNQEADQGENLLEESTVTSAGEKDQRRGMQEKVAGRVGGHSTRTGSVRCVGHFPEKQLIQAERQTGKIFEKGKASDEEREHRENGGERPIPGARPGQIADEDGRTTKHKANGGIRFHRDVTGQDGGEEPDVKHPTRQDGKPEQNGQHRQKPGQTQGRMKGVMAEDDRLIDRRWKGVIRLNHEYNSEGPWFQSLSLVNIMHDSLMTTRRAREAAEPPGNREG